MQGKSKYKKAKKYYGGLQPVPVEEPRTGGEVASGIMSAASVGAKAGSFAGPVGSVVGGVGSALAMGASQFIKKKQEGVDKRDAEALNQKLENAYGGFGKGGVREDEYNTYIASEGKGVGMDINEKVAEIHDKEIHGKPIYDNDGVVINFKTKNVAPDKTHAELKGKDNRALLPTPEGKKDKNISKEIRDKDALLDEDAILHKEDKKVIDKANSGDRQAQLELTKIIAEKPTDEDYGYENNDMKKSTKRKYAKGKGVEMASNLANEAGVMSSMVGDYVRSQSPVKKVERNYLESNPMEYVRDTAKEEQAITENRNAAMTSMRGKAATMGQANIYARAIQRGYDDSVGKMEAREDMAKIGIDKENIADKRNTSAGNLELKNNYNTIDRSSEENQNLFDMSYEKKLSDYSQVNKRENSQRSLDNKKMEMDQETMKYLATKNMSMKRNANGELVVVYNKEG